MPLVEIKVHGGEEPVKDLEHLRDGFKKLQENYDIDPQVWHDVAKTLRKDSLVEKPVTSKKEAVELFMSAYLKRKRKEANVQIEEEKETGIDINEERNQAIKEINEKAILATKKVGKAASKISGTSEGIAEGLSHQPLVGGLIGLVVGISSFMTLKEANAIVGAFEVWVAGTAALTISKSVENALKKDLKNSKTKRLLSAFIIAASFASFYEGSQIMNNNIPETPKPQISPTKTTETEIPPFNSPFSFTGKYIRTRVYSPNEWGNITRWKPFIKDAISTTGLDITLEKEGIKGLELMESILWIESRGNPYALSTKGAVGLFQIMPSDGVSSLNTCQYGPCFSDRLETWQLFDEKTNTLLAAKILNDKINRLKSVKSGIMSYGQQGIGTDYYDLVFGLYQKIIGK